MAGHGKAAPRSRQMLPFVFLMLSLQFSYSPPSPFPPIPSASLLTPIARPPLPFSLVTHTPLGHAAVVQTKGETRVRVRCAEMANVRPSDTLQHRSRTWQTVRWWIPLTGSQSRRRSRQVPVHSTLSHPEPVHPCVSEKGVRRPFFSDPSSARAKRQGLEASQDNEIPSAKAFPNL